MNLVLWKLKGNSVSQYVKRNKLYIALPRHYLQSFIKQFQVNNIKVLLIVVYKFMGLAQNLNFIFKKLES